jgi:hypothetical protein
VAASGKTYLVENADKNAEPDIPPAVFPGTLKGLLDALDAARYRSASSLLACGVPIRDPTL